MHNTNKPPDNGQPCRIPDINDIRSVIELFILILNVALHYNNLIQFINVEPTPERFNVSKR